MRYLMIVAGGMALLAGCNDDGQLEGEPVLGGPLVTVYEGGPRVKQCEQAVTTVALSAQKLSTAGVPPTNSGCGVVHVAYPAVCGAGTGFIIVHDIPSEGLERAQQSGFAAASTLRKPSGEDGWNRVECLN